MGKYEEELSREMVMMATATSWLIPRTHNAGTHLFHPIGVGWPVTSPVRFTLSCGSATVELRATATLLITVLLTNSGSEQACKESQILHEYNDGQ